MITILPATTDHVADIHAIERKTFSEPWSSCAISQEIENKHSICFSAWDTVNRTVVGYVTMRHIINEGHISNIAVSQKYQQQGIGTMLLTTLIRAAIDCEMIGLTLEVRVSNQAALALYRKHGFVEEGRRKNYYAYPNEDAIIMWKYITLTPR